MGEQLNIVTKLHKQTKRDYLDRMVNNKVECMLKAKEYEFDYWDGDRKYGYGGYKFIENSFDLSQFILNADCLITAVGATIFEGLALGTPCIVISNFLSDNLDEKKLEKMNNVSVLGYYANVFKNNNFFYGVLTSLREKINAPAKNRRK